MNSSMTRQRAVVELALAGAIWGFGFIAAVWSMEAMGPVWVTVLRFLIAFLIGIPVLFLRRAKWSDIKSDAHLSALTGVMISSTLILQTWGLRYTTATKSSFITCLYVILVPLLEVVITGRRFHYLHLLAAGGGLTGMYLMTGVEASAFNLGDVLTFFCACAAALHIVWISRVEGRVKSTFQFNMFQSLWAAGFALFVALLLEPFEFHGFTTRSAVGLLSLSIGSTALAFFLQVRAQKILSASTASTLFLLESPFATTFAILLLGETLHSSQIMGGPLILLSALMAIRADRYVSKRAV